MANTVLYAKQDHLVTITLNRPEQHNALNREMYQSVSDAFDRANADKDVRCIIFTGAGRSFCSGDDVAEIMASDTGLKNAVSNPPLALAMTNSRCPIIAAVNGAAVGYGMELTLLADIRIASERARFSEMFIRRGIIATQISYNLLPDLVGHAVAAQMLLTGEMIDAETAAKVGLVTKVTVHDDLLAEVTLLASQIAANPPLATQRAKQALNLKRAGKVGELDPFLTASLVALANTRDHKESVSAFLEKREGVYTGE